MTERTITALYETRQDAEQAKSRLIANGVQDHQISLRGDGSAAAGATTGTAATGSSRDDSFLGMLKDIFVPDEDRATYAEGMRRGGVLIVVKAPESMVDTAVHVLEGTTGAVDVETRSQEWRDSGWSGWDEGTSRSEARTEQYRTGDTTSTVGRSAIPPAGTAVPDTGQTMGAMRQGDTGQTMGRGTMGFETGDTDAETTRLGQHDEGQSIPIVEEQLRVSKRETGRGSVRVRSYVVETPVEEQVTLRQEQVTVDRRTVDRELRPGEEVAAFQDRTIEVSEHSEEAVVDKTARVTGEVVLNKESTERTETVHDTVRRTEVEVDDQTRDTARTEVDETKRTVPRRP